MMPPPTNLFQPSYETLVFLVIFTAVLSISPLTLVIVLLLKRRPPLSLIVSGLFICLAPLTMFFPLILAAIFGRLDKTDGGKYIVMMPLAFLFLLAGIGSYLFWALRSVFSFVTKKLANSFA